MPVSKRRNKPKQPAAANTSVSTGSKLRALWRNANVTQKGGAVLAAAVAIGGATYTIRIARLPKVCYHSESELPAKTSIYAGLGDKGNLVTEAERLALIETGLNQELEKVKAKDTGFIFDRNLDVVGRFSGVSAVLQTAKPITALPSKYTLTVANKQIEIDPQDLFKVTSNAVTIGVHSFPLKDVVSIFKRGDASLYMVPNGRVTYNLIGKDPRYSCAALN